jgi:hypothetical protein
MGFNETMQEILETRRYDRLMGRTRNIWASIADFIEGRVDALLRRLNITFPWGENDTSVIPLIFAIIGGVLFAVGLFVLIRMLIRVRRPKAHNLLGLFEGLTDKGYTVSDLLTMSNEAETQRLSIRYRYIAALLALDERQIIKISPSATNASILRIIKNEHPPLVKPFTDMANIFHLAWFGYKEIGDTDYLMLCAAGDKLMDAVCQLVANHG